ncbi:hypothetical protein, partial [Clostridioides difficile]|uniref:hypothetical protein n=1 Tax=Clostridioides difficile TaxID=1496 RepID=UPI002ED59D1A
MRVFSNSSIISSNPSPSSRSSHAFITYCPLPRDGIDFFPLSVDYEEKLYSVGKIPGGFLKREGKPSEKAILT